MKFVAYIISLIVIGSLFFACDDNDKFSSDSSLRLSYSSDTVRFDTVFSTFGSATKQFKIYNRNKDAITISSINIMSPNRSGFRMNVDGESGSNINNIDILGKDSTYVFVEITVDPLYQNNPLLISDSIRIQYNGVTQYVHLEAIGQDVTFWQDKVIDKDTTLTGDKPFLIYNTLLVNKGVTLDIKENVHLYFHKDARLQINGSINAVGTIQKPIVMRGDRMDNIFTSVPYDRVPGQWDGVYVSSDSYNNRFENVRIRNGVRGIVFNESSDVITQKALLLNTMVQNTTKEGVLAVNCNIRVENSLLTNSLGSPVRLVGGNYYFLQTTIANYISTYWGGIRQAALILSNTGLNVDDKTVTYPLSNAQFINTIVSGTTNSELRESQSDAVAFNRQFINCLLKVKGADDANFVNIVWNVDPFFKYIYGSSLAEDNPNLRFYYNFELTKESPAINKGARSYIVDLPLDIRGVSRRSNQAPDIGCYEWVSE